MFRPAYIYEDRPEDDDQEAPLQWSNRNEININYIDGHWSTTPRSNTHRFPRPVDLDFDRSPSGRHPYRGYRHITVPRDQPRPLPPRFDLPNLSRRSPRYGPYTTYPLPPRWRTGSVDNPQLITVLLPGGDQAVIGLSALSYYFPNAGDFIINQVLDIPAFIRAQHRAGPEAALPDLQDELLSVARHIFILFNESVAGAYEDTFEEWCDRLGRGGPYTSRAALRAFAMCCLFDQGRSLGCAEELGMGLMMFLEEALQIMTMVDAADFWVPWFFNGAARVMTDGSREQEEILRSIWRGIEQVGGRCADVLVRTYRQADARGGVEGVRARRVLRIIL